MIDENVHFVHTRKLVDVLIKENKPYLLQVTTKSCLIQLRSSFIGFFIFQIYPKERHGIRSPDASLHCDVNLYSFLEQNL